MITEAQIGLVQESWKAVLPIADTAADLFYGKLFELDGNLRPLFPEDLSEQKKKLMQMIGIAVGGLTRLETIVPAVQDLGRRHAGYNVTPDMYGTVGAALLWTLETGLGDAWDDDVAAAWAGTYGLLSSTMIAAAEEGA